MEKIENKNVMHVASLAKLDIKSEEVEKYINQLNDILTEIEKIKEVNIEGDIMISPSTNTNLFREFNGNDLNKNEMLKTSPKHESDFIAVERVLND